MSNTPQFNDDFDYEIIEEEVVQPQEESGLNLTLIKETFLRLNKNGLYATIFHYFCLVLFASLVWIYLTSNFNFLPEVYNASASDAPIYVSHRFFRILFWTGLVLLFIVILANFLQRKLRTINTIPMLLLYGGYALAGGFYFISQPLYHFLSQYFNNKDPFRAFEKPAEVLSNLNYELYGFFLIGAITLFGFAFLLIIMRKLNLKPVVARHN